MYTKSNTYECSNLVDTNMFKKVDKTYIYWINGLDSIKILCCMLKLLPFYLIPLIELESPKWYCSSKNPESEAMMAM